MRSNKFLTPFLITLGAMGLFALIYAVSVDVYDSLFWARFIFTLIAIPLAVISVMRAIRQTGLPLVLRSLCIIALYIIGCFGVICFIPYAALVTILCLALNICYGLFLFLDHGIMKGN